MSTKVLVSSDRSTHIVGLGWEGAIAFRAASTLGGVDFEEDGAIALLADKSLANKGQYKRDAALHFRC